MKKIILTIALVCLCITVAYCQTTDGVQRTVVKNGVGLGSAIAVAISWSRNKSILMAIVHGVLGWFYVIYYAIVRGEDE